MSSQLQAEWPSDAWRYLALVHVARRIGDELLRRNIQHEVSGPALAEIATDVLRNSNDARLTERNMETLVEPSSGTQVEFSVIGRESVNRHVVRAFMLELEGWASNLMTTSNNGFAPLELLPNETAWTERRLVTALNIAKGAASKILVQIMGGSTVTPAMGQDFTRSVVKTVLDAFAPTVPHPSSHAIDN